MSGRAPSLGAAAVLACAVWAFAPPRAAAEPSAAMSHSPATLDPRRAEPLPSDLEGIDIVEHLDAQLPLDLELRDEDGRAVRLAELLDGDRPAILTLGYYRCPMLCSLVLNGLVESLREVSWSAGREFQLLTLSIDPLESPALARLKKQSYLREYGRPGAEEGWRFLTGTEAAVRRVAETVGFGYRWDEDTQQYVHAAAVFVLTPDGRVSRYLYGVQYDPRTVRLSLAEASAGRYASTLDKIILFCFHYDAGEGRYAPAAVKVMRAGGLVTALALGTVVAAGLRRGRRRPEAAE